MHRLLRAYCIQNKNQAIIPVSDIWLSAKKHPQEVRLTHEIDINFFHSKHEDLWSHNNVQLKSCVCEREKSHKQLSHCHLDYINNNRGATQQRAQAQLVANASRFLTFYLHRKDDVCGVYRYRYQGTEKRKVTWGRRGSCSHKYQNTKFKI